MVEFGLLGQIQHELCRPPSWIRHHDPQCLSLNREGERIAIEPKIGFELLRLSSGSSRLGQFATQAPPAGSCLCNAMYEPKAGVEILLLES